MSETVRHARLLFLLSVILNTLFFVSDWRFYGQPHFWVAIPARAVVVAVSLACFLLIRRAADFRRAQRTMLAWEWITGAAVAALVSSHSDIAFFVVLMLPSIYYLGVPTSFRWTLLSGVGCSAMMLAGYEAPGPLSSTLTGMILAMLMLNCALALVVIRSNRLRRLEWAATQAERLANNALAESREMFERMFMAVPIPLVVTAKIDGRLIKANHAALSYFGGTPETLGIHSIEQVYDDPKARAALLAGLEGAGRVDGFETRVRLADGAVRDVLLAASALVVGETESVMAGVVDITGRKAMEAHLARLATTDPLTGLANRTQFFARAEAEIQRAARYRRPLSILMVDLDHFKRINDTYGHEVGDRALQAFAALCKRTLRQQDCAARLGGEEFAALLPETDGPGALLVAERLRAAVEEMRLENAPLTLRLTASIGLSEVQPGETGPDAALSRADRALYAAKRAGRNRVVDHRGIEPSAACGTDCIPR
ncbi:diguanylate cyclase [Azospirillum sp. sgz302134]